VDQTNIIYDDLMFNSCLVSLGCMGVIYAIVLRVRQQYDLIETTVASTWNGFVSTATGLLADTNNRFLQVAIDPYSSDNKCMITTRKEAAASTPGRRPGPSPDKVVDTVLTFLKTANYLDVANWTAHGLLEIPNAPIPVEQKIQRFIQLVLTQTPGA